MSPHRAPYFSKRRQRLRNRHLCTRCGSDRAKAGFVLCAACLAVKAIKASPTPSEAEIKAKESKRKRLLNRLDLIDEARRAVQAELDRVT